MCFLTYNGLDVIFHYTTILQTKHATTSGISEVDFVPTVRLLLYTRISSCLDSALCL